MRETLDGPASWQAGRLASAGKTTRRQDGAQPLGERRQAPPARPPNQLVDEARNQFLIGRPGRPAPVPLIGRDHRRPPANSLGRLAGLSTGPSGRARRPPDERDRREMRDNSIWLATNSRPAISCSRLSSRPATGRARAPDKMRSSPRDEQLFGAARAGGLATCATCGYLLRPARHTRQTLGEPIRADDNFSMISSRRRGSGLAAGR